MYIPQTESKYMVISANRYMFVHKEEYVILDILSTICFHSCYQMHMIQAFIPLQETYIANEFCFYPEYMIYVNTGTNKRNQFQ